MHGMLPTCIALHAHLYCSSSKDNKAWGEDEVDENAQQSRQDGGGASSSSAGGETEGAQTGGAGATDSDGNVTKPNTDGSMETGMLTTVQKDPFLLCICTYIPSAVCACYQLA